MSAARASQHRFEHDRIHVRFNCAPWTDSWRRSRFGPVLPRRIRPAMDAASWRETLYPNRVLTYTPIGYDNSLVSTLILEREFHGIVISTSLGLADRGHDLRRLRVPRRAKPEQASGRRGEREFRGGVGAGHRGARRDFAGDGGRGNPQDRVLGTGSSGRIHDRRYDLRGVRGAHRKGPEQAGRCAR